MASFVKGFATGFLGKANEQYDAKRQAAAEKDKLFFQHLLKRSGTLNDAYVEASMKAKEKQALVNEYVSMGISPAVAERAVITGQDPSKFQLTEEGKNYKYFNNRNFQTSVDEIYGPLFSQAQKNVPKKYQDRYKTALFGMGVPTEKLFNKPEVQGPPVPPPEGPLVQTTPDYNIVSRETKDASGNVVKKSFRLNTKDGTLIPIEGLDSSVAPQIEFKTDKVVIDNDTGKVLPGVPFTKGGTVFIRQGNMTRPLSSSESLRNFKDTAEGSKGDSSTPKNVDDLLFDLESGTVVGAVVRIGEQLSVLPWGETDKNKAVPISEYNNSRYRITNQDSLNKSTLSGDSFIREKEKVEKHKASYDSLTKYKNTVLNAGFGVQSTYNRWMAMFKTALNKENISEAEINSLFQDPQRAQLSGAFKSTFGDAQMSNFELENLFNAIGGQPSMFRNASAFEQAVNNLIKSSADKYNSSLPVYNYNAKYVHTYAPAMEPISKETLDKELETKTPTNVDAQIKKLKLEDFDRSDIRDKIRDAYLYNKPLYKKYKAWNEHLMKNKEK